MRFLQPQWRKAQTTDAPPLQTLDSAGGEGTSEGGSISFSVGQFSYTTVSTSRSAVFQGVQLPKFLNPPTIPVEKPVTFNIKTYPNPTTDFFIIEIKYYENESLSYEFYSLQGQLIERKPITSSKTKVKSTNLSNSLYLLRIMYKNTPIKITKIIKR